MAVMSRRTWRAQTAPASEPLLNVDNIQGNILVGFNKDFQTLLFFTIEDVAAFRPSLDALSHEVATLREVRDFAELFKQWKARRGGREGTLAATWLHLAFSYSGLAKLTRDTPADLRAADFSDIAFRQGMAERAAHVLGDPADGEGSPGGWKIGGPHHPVDGVLIVAGDDRASVSREGNRLRDKRDGVQGVRWTTHQDHGAALHAANGQAQVHFDLHGGIADGISQPAIRGLAADGTSELVWPGEFVFGYPGQDPDAGPEHPGPDKHAGPPWAVDGSFLVFRRLTQHVDRFQWALDEVGKQLDISPAEAGARIVGRDRQGAPLVPCSTGDNAFEFAVEDPDGRLCPWAAHIRKANPRDDVRPELLTESTADAIEESAWDSLRHRLVRRGIPFGPPVGGDGRPDNHAQERGLLFLAYQTSIEGQFEHIVSRWLNDADFHLPGSGADLLLGQRGPHMSAAAEFGPLLDGHSATVSSPAPWIVTTGGGYFFAPSIKALSYLANPQDRNREKQAMAERPQDGDPNDYAFNFNALIKAANPYAPKDMYNALLDQPPVNMGGPANGYAPAATASQLYRISGPAKDNTPDKTIYDDPSVQKLLQDNMNSMWWYFEGQPHRVIKAILVPYEHGIPGKDDGERKQDFILIGFVGIQPP
jgi:Dyp-type peroxidase family